MTPDLQLRGVRHVYPDGIEALRGVDLVVEKGRRVALTGANSAGKSTLLLHCNGCLFPTEGETLVRGVPVARKTLPEIRRMVGTVFQDPDDQLFMPSIAEDVAFGPRNMGLVPDEVERRVDEALEAVGCSHLAGRRPQRLSGGEKRAAALAAALSMRPDILLLDEPTANLDPRARRQCIDLMRRLPQTLVIATHDLDMVLEVCPRTVVLHEGRVHADGPTGRIFADAALLEACRLETPLCMAPCRAHPDAYPPSFSPHDGEEKF